MSLSKPVVFETTSSQYSLPRGIQLGIIIGVPIAITAAVGVCWWTGVFSSNKSTKKSVSADDKDSQELSETLKPEREDLRPAYVRLKEEGNDSFKKGDFVKALEFYAKAIEETPPPTELAFLYQNRAAVFEKLGDWVQVINESSAALKLNSRYIKALGRRSKAYRQTGFIEEALEDITAVCVLESFAVSSSVQIADDILKEIGKSEAERLMKDKKPSPPSNHAVVAFLRAFYCDPVSRWWIDSSTEPIVNGPSIGDSLPITGGFPAALAALNDRKYDNIIEFCTEEIESPVGKNIDEARLLRATFRHLWGYQEEVLEDFSKITESKTASNELKASAFVKMGSQIAMQNDDKYEEYFQKAEVISPNCVDIFHQRGQILLTKGEFEAAIVQIQKANEICPDFALAAASKWYVEYRIAHVNQDETGVTNALKNFNKCMRKFDKSPDVISLYGQILMELGRFQEAIAQFDHVIKLDPSNAAIYVHKAVAEYQMEGDMEKVLHLLRESLKIDDRNEFVYETIGTLELQAGNLEQAHRAISKALDLAKTSQELMMLSSLKKAAEVQSKVKVKYNVAVPSISSYKNPGY